VTTNPTVKVSFPTDNSTASQSARLNAAAVTLQNLEGAGVGCPIASTTFTAQQKAINAETSTPAPATSSSATPAVSATSSVVLANATAANGSTTPTDAQIAALAPPLGWQSGINPDGKEESTEYCNIRS